MKLFGVLTIAAVLTLSASAKKDLVGTSYSLEEIETISSLENFVSNSSCNFYLEFEKVFDYCSEKDYVQSFALPYC